MISTSRVDRSCLIFYVCDIFFQRRILYAQLWLLYMLARSPVGILLSDIVYYRIFHIHFRIFHIHFRRFHEIIMGRDIVDGFEDVLFA